MALSRIGKKAIVLPSAVKVAVDGQTVNVQGPKGKMARTLKDVQIRLANNELIVDVVEDTRVAKAKHGLARALLQNMVTGVSVGFKRDLEITGTGYRADVKGNVLEMSLGYSHPVRFELPAGITASVDKQTKISIEGADKELLGLVAAKVRGFRPPEPYKGKGIKYSDEVIVRKEGKTGGKKK